MKKINRKIGIIGFYFTLILAGLAIQFSWPMNSWNLLFVSSPALIGTAALIWGE